MSLLVFIKDVKMMIEIRDLKKTLGNKAVLEGLNLEIEEGKVFGLVGINGAGKSTLLRCLAGVYKIDSGSVQIDGKDVYENPEIKKDILLINDDPYYAMNNTIEDIKELYASFYNFDEERYQKYLKVFKLDSNKPINNFSKGMKRQVFIIMALAICPKILILDEAFDGLDPFVRLTFKRALTDLIEDKNITVIISSHNLRELEDICDSFGILENHCIQTSGDIQEQKDNIHKIQVVFNDEIIKETLTKLDILHYHKVGRVITLVCRGDIEEINTYLNEFNPLLVDSVAISFEEMFIYEMENKGYVYNE